jgi:hypothetical protein
VVARVLRERTEGNTAYAIARDLNKDAVPTAQGARAWSQATVRALLMRPQREPASPFQREPASPFDSVVRAPGRSVIAGREVEQQHPALAGNSESDPVASGAGRSDGRRPGAPPGLLRPPQRLAPLPPQQPRVPDLALTQPYRQDPRGRVIDDHGVSCERPREPDVLGSRPHR